jgi:hypothetical protein
MCAGKAWQTPFGAYVPQLKQAGRPAWEAHCVVLQLPLEGVLAGGGIAAVLKRPPGAHPEWLTGPARRDIFVPFQEARISCRNFLKPLQSTMHASLQSL